MTVTLTLSANAGIALQMQDLRLWVDALHEDKQPKFSTLSPQYQRLVATDPHFQHPKYICFTHCHGDHYSERLTKAAVSIWPNAKVLAPEGEFAFLHESLIFPAGEGEIRYIPLPHEGKEYAQVRHYGILLSVGGKNVFFSGDCAVGSQEILHHLQAIPVHLMVLDFPWMTLPKGRAFLDEHFPNTQKILLHLPFAHDDRFGYRVAAAKVAQKRHDTHLLCDPLQTISLDI